MSTPRALLLLAPGAEEMEVSIIVDVLRRAAVEVIVAGVEGGEPVRCSRQLVIQPDVALAAIEGDFDVLLLPGGGEGARRLCANPAVGSWLRRHEQEGRWVGAICAAPSALAAHGVFAGKRMTLFPGLEDKIATHGRHSTERVVSDGKLVTSQGPGTAFEFALTLVANLQGVEKAEQVERQLLLPR